MSKNRKKRNHKRKSQNGNQKWELFHAYNELNCTERKDALRKLGIIPENEEVLGQLTKSHFVVPGKTRFECQQCGECCRYAKKSAMFTYDPCPFLGDDNLCIKHDQRYQVCKWFPFWVYPSKKYGNILTIKPYCNGYGKGDFVDYEYTLKTLLELRESSIKDPDGAVVIHEVIRIPGHKEWTFPGIEAVDELMNSLNQKSKISSETRSIHKSEITSARNYTSGLLGTIDDPNITIDSDGDITDVNLAFASVFEESIEDVLDTNITDYFKENEKAKKIIESCLVLGKTTGTILNYRKGNVVKPVLCDAAVYRDVSDGLIHGILMVLRPVSKDVYYELECSQHYARGLIESSPDLMVAVDVEGIITDVNEAAVRITGRRRDALIGTQFKDYFSEPLAAQKGIKLSLEKKQIKDYQLNILTDNDESIPVSFSASTYYNPDGSIQGVFAVARDITEIKNIHEELLRSYNYARGLIECSCDPMATIDLNGIIIDVNQSMEELVRLERDKIIGSYFRDYFTSPTNVDQGISMICNKGCIRDFILTRCDQSGEKLNISVNASEYKDSNNETIGIFAVARVEENNEFQMHTISQGREVLHDN